MSKWIFITGLNRTMMRHTELVTIFDGYKCVQPPTLLSFISNFTRYIGTMQICVSRMLKESGIFFAVWTCSLYGLLCPITSHLQLLSVLAIGFAQGLYAVDASDGSTEPPSTVKIFNSWCLNTSWLAHDVTGGQCFGSSFTGVGSFFSVGFGSKGPIYRSPDFGKFDARYEFFWWWVTLPQ